MDLREAEARSERRLNGSKFSDLVMALSERSRVMPSEVAFVWLSDGESNAVSCSYRDLQVRASCIASRLRQTLSGGERVLLLYPPGLDFVVALCGCLFAGMVAVPAYPPDAFRHKISIDRLRSIARQAKCAAVLTDSAETQQKVCAEVACLTSVDWVHTREPRTEWGHFVQQSVDPTTPALLQYTSGSTASPKGVVLTHRNIIENQRLVNRAMGCRATSTVVNWLPLYHDMGLIGGVMTSIVLGSRNVLLSPFHVLQRPVRWLRAITRYRATHSGGPNFGYQHCVQKLGADDKRDLDLSSWQCAYNGAEPIRAATLAAFADAFSGVGFRAQSFYCCYGLAESTLFVAGRAGVPRVHEPEPRQEKWSQEARGHQVDHGLVSVGRPCGDTELEIVDATSHRRCAAGEVGEIWVRGSSVGAGYWALADATRATFEGYLEPERVGPFLRTGDHGVLVDGELFVCGRIKDLIISAGRKIHAEDVEVTVADVDPCLRLGATAAFAVNDDAGEAVVVVAAVDAGSARHGTELSQRVAAAVTRTHQVRVASVVLIRPSELPRTSSGKVQRQRCRSLHASGKLRPLVDWSPRRHDTHATR